MKNDPAPTNDSDTSIRGAYQRYGVQGFYERFGERYRNPHEAAIGQVLAIAVNTWRVDVGSVLDLACGSGEVTLALRQLGADHIDGIDPYTGAAYLARTGQTAAAYTFDQIAAGCMADRADEPYSLIICSFALHLAAESRLPVLVYQLSLIGESLLILSPHKRPHLKAGWGWMLIEETVRERVRAKLYKGVL